MIEAVLWDFGGVITSSPFESFNRYEQAHGLPHDFIRSINATNPDTNAWAQFESAQITLEQFDDRFAAEAGNRGHEVRGTDVLALLSGELRPEMVSAIRIIKQRLKIGCITNNVNTGRGPSMSTDGDSARRMDEVLGLFDVLIESSKAGIRKPDPRIYQLACRELDVSPTDTVFLDDLGVNLKPARAMGMSTIKVLSSAQALNELESLLKFSLR